MVCVRYIEFPEKLKRKLLVVAHWSLVHISSAAASSAAGADSRDTQFDVKVGLHAGRSCSRCFPGDGVAVGVTGTAVGGGE